jgi:hypothetical protein
MLVSGIRQSNQKSSSRSFSRSLPPTPSFSQILVKKRSSRNAQDYRIMERISCLNSCPTP